LAGKKFLHRESPDFSLIISLYVTAWLFLPPPILNSFIPYSVPGGFFLFKFHPATWIFAVWLCTRPLDWLTTLGRFSFGNRVTSFLSVALCGYFVLVDKFALLSTFIDILVVPSIIAELILSGLVRVKTSLVIDLVLVIILLTAVALYVEVGTGFRVVEREGYDPYNRPGGWHGHPLAAATILLVGIVLVGCRSDEAGRLGSLAAIFLFGGIVLSGTRGPLLTGAVCLILIFTKKMVAGTLAQKLGIFLSCAVILPFGISYAVESGAFDRFLSLGFDDDSTDARRGIWDVFYLLTKSELLWGISSYDVIADLALATSGVPYVENAFVLVYLQSGGIAAVIYFLIVVGLCFSASIRNFSYGFVVLGAFLGTITFATKGTASPMIILTGALVLATARAKPTRQLIAANS
jgi:hypothetical protein